MNDNKARGLVRADNPDAIIVGAVLRTEDGVCFKVLPWQWWKRAWWWLLLRVGVDHRPQTMRVEEVPRDY